MNRPVKQTASVINIHSYKTGKKTKSHLLRVDFWKHTKTGEFSYTMKKHGKRRITDDFAAYGLTCVIEDIMMYNNDPYDILEFTEEMIYRLGYEELDEDGED